LLQNTNQQLSLDKEQLTQQKARLDQQLTVSNEQMAQLQQILARLKLDQQIAQDNFAKLQSEYNSRRNELEAALNDINMREEALALLQGDYDSLKVKYDKLVRPARTPVGKYVVEVRYVKENDKYQIAYKTPEMDSFSNTSQNELETRLAQLKKNDPNKLYIKVIFPENSGLSYSEAWEFTSRLHKRYDYYFQE
jgi:chromosome segregation ATPase